MGDRGKLRLGSSSWTAKGWLGRFYPKGTKPVDFIAHYATIYDSVEIDATFYAVPAESTVLGWRDKTPDDFVFAAKAPQVITHEKFLEDCEQEVFHFLDRMSLLGPKLGPILFQFPYYSKKKGVTEDEFLRRLRAFAAILPRDGFRFAVEVRNKTWIDSELCEILRDHGLALTLIDHPWMHRPSVLMKNREIVTADFAYVRWLGDRHGIEKITKVWNETVVDRSKEIEEWAPPIRDMLGDQVDVYGYVNNHYGGYAPENIDALTQLLSA